MKRLFAVIVIFTACIACASAKEVTFYVGQSHDGWAFDITGKGRSIVGESLIFTRIDSLQVTNNPKHKKSKNIEFVSVGYGYRKPDGTWAVEVAGPRLEVGRVIGPGDFMTFNRLDGVLSLKDKKPGDYWVIITIGMESRSTVYAHSREDIFQ